LREASGALTIIFGPCVPITPTVTLVGRHLHATFREWMGIKSCMANRSDEHRYKRCRQCGYILDWLETNRCPECFRRFDPNDSETYGPPLYRKRHIVFVLVTTAASWSIILLYWHRSDGTDFAGMVLAAVSLFAGRRLHARSNNTGVQHLMFVCIAASALALLILWGAPPLY